MKTKKIFIAGGGTGGHIYPGIAIAQALLKLSKQADVHFVGTSSGLETKIIPKDIFPLHLIQGGKLNFQGGVLAKIKTLIKLPIGLFQSFAIIFKYKPDFVLGVGGYASGPFVLAAALSGVSTAIWEPNAHPGLANRWLSFFVDQCFVVFEEAKNYLNNKKISVFGMPVRAEIEQAEVKPRQHKKFHLLSFGGSQGSRAISAALSDAILAGGDWTKNLSVVHQIGALDFNKLKEKYKGTEDLVSVHEFIYNMPDYYAWADLVVCRGGASTINEVAAFGVVPIIIPLPAADDHQQKNAESIVNAQAGIMLLQKDLSANRLVEEIQKIRNDDPRRAQMTENIKKFFRPKAADKIAEVILFLIGK